jgi:hypothetical protein
MKRKEKPVPIFKQFVGETAKSFMHRITMKCQVIRVLLYGALFLIYL